MIIGIDGHMLGDKSGGNESYYTNILRTMPVDKEDTVYLFVKKEVDVSEFENKFKIIRFNSGSSFIRNFWELNQLCKKYNLDLLHTQYFIPFIRSCKVVCTIHDICFEHYKNIFTKKEYYRQKLLIPYAAKHSEFIYTVSEHAKNDIATSYKISPDKIIVTYDAVNTDEFRVLSSDELNEQELRHKYNIGDADYVLSVGNLQPRKNLPRLIEAFNDWKKDKNNNAKLVIVGKKAWMYSDILRTAGSTNDDIIFTDYVSDKDLVRLYNAARCFIYPSFFEGFGIPPLEAMACGKPVGVANTSALPEVVGDAGLLFDPFDTDEIRNKMDELYGNSETWNKLSKAGLERAKHFSWEVSSKKIYESYHLI